MTNNRNIYKTLFHKIRMETKNTCPKKQERNSNIQKIEMKGGKN